jgi:hypothetical protein
VPGTHAEIATKGLFTTSHAALFQIAGASPSFEMNQLGREGRYLPSRQLRAKPRETLKDRVMVFRLSHRLNFSHAEKTVTEIGYRSRPLRAQD